MSEFMLYPPIWVHSYPSEGYHGRIVCLYNPDRFFEECDICPSDDGNLAQLLTIYVICGTQQKHMTGFHIYSQPISAWQGPIS